ncbi:tether containing UBX domain for GLUT4-like [Rhopilema esculentum]|uniref:tether containing UBX domain for GLUT4-like n=1 Tax=Rhopilema esculentum TaxID=499914 RepID=UPI0031D10676
MRIHSLKTGASEETPLMTKNMRRTKDLEKAMRYKKVIIRVQFPDKFVLQGVFRPLEPVGAVKQFVREHLQNSVDNFHLYTTPPKCLLKDDKQTLHQAKLIPAALVHVSSTQSSELVLRNELIEEAVSYLEAENKAFDILKKRNTDKKAPSLQSSDVSAPTTSSSRETTATETQRKPTASEFMPSKADGSSDRKVPKWFR